MKGQPAKVVAIRHGEASLGPIESRLGYQLHQADLAHMELLRHMLDPVGLTPARATAIAFIANNPGAGQSDLARALGINRASAMEIVNHLVAIGAVERRAGRDKRSNALALTAQGKALSTQFNDIAVGLDEILSAELTPEEVGQFAALLTKVRSATEKWTAREYPES